MTTERSFELAGTRPPWIVLAPPGDEPVAVQLAEVERHGTVYRLDPRQLLDPRPLFAEFARKLAFPDHFGHNWDALVDCLDDLHRHDLHRHDLHRHGGQSACVVIDPADDLVFQPFFGLLLDVLCEAAERANRSLDADGRRRDRRPVPLHFVLTLDHTGMAAAEQRLRERDGIVSAGAGGHLLLTAEPDRPAFHAWFADRAERVGRRRTDFGEAVWAWADLVEHGTKGYERGLAEFVAERSVRQRLELVFSPEADGVDGVSLARADVGELDDAYREALLPGVVVEPDAPNWWERGIPRRGGARFAREVRKRYGVHIEPGAS